MTNAQRRRSQCGAHFVLMFERQRVTQKVRSVGCRSAADCYGTSTLEYNHAPRICLQSQPSATHLQFLRRSLYLEYALLEPGVTAAGMPYQEPYNQKQSFLLRFGSH